MSIFSEEETNNSLIVAGIAFLVFAVTALFIDSQLTLLSDVIVSGFFLDLRTEMVTQWMIFISLLFEPLHFFLIGCGIALLSFLERQTKVAVLFIFSFLSLAFSIWFLKEFFQGLRPLNALIAEIGWSFPSAHTAFAFMFALLVSFLIAHTQNETHYKVAVILTVFFVAVLVAGSRLYLGVHWFSDIVGGIGLATFWVFLYWYALTKIQHEDKTFGRYLDSGS